MSHAQLTETASPDRGTARPVSRHDDAAEREADRAAEVVASGGRVRGWSLTSAPPTPVGVQRAPGDEKKDEKKDGDDHTKKQLIEAAKKTGEALRKTKVGKDLEKAILESEPVKKVKEAATSPAGIVTGSLLGAGAIAGLAATNQKLPMQPPAIPFDFLLPGLSVQPHYEGRLQSPTYVGLTVTFKPKAKKKPRRPAPSPEPEPATQAEPERVGPTREKLERARQTEAALDTMILGQRYIPPFGIPVMALELNPRATSKDDEAEPVRRAPTSTGADRTGGGVAAVDDGFSGPGRPLDDAVRRRMETRFGHDFSAVRLHDDQRATAAAARVDARAFTVGEDIVLGRGQDASSSHLLAHELAHVVQQAHGSAPRDVAPVRRLGVLDTIGVALGLVEGDWSDDELEAYLAEITDTDAIGGDHDDDNKARAIVGRWRDATPRFELTPRQKVLLVEEMLDGPTLGADEEAILELLARSDAHDQRAILGPEGVGLEALEDNIHHGNRRLLDAWVSGRFVGGRDAVLAGRLEVQGDLVPSGAPAVAYHEDRLDSWVDGDWTAQDIIAILEGFDEADRDRALHHLSQVRRVALDERIARLARRFLDETDDGRRDAIRRVIGDVKELRLKIERVLLHFLRGEVPADEADLRSSTTATDPAERPAIDEALRPPAAPTSSGTRPDFEPTLPGETHDYEHKLAALLVDIVDQRHQRMVVGRGPTEHADPTETRALADFQPMAEAARRETLAVFGRFASGPSMRVDEPPVSAGGTGARHNIHDRFSDFDEEHRRMGRGQRRDNARALVMYFFQSDSRVRLLNGLHHADPEFDASRRPANDEARALARVANAFVRDRANVVRLNEIDRAWPAVAQPETGEIWIQRFRGETPEEDRLLLWDMFQTFIHEYLHTLAHPDYSTYAESFGDTSNAFNTLIEGVDSLLTEIVWDAVEPRAADPSLRAEVEGQSTADSTEPIEVPHASQRRYPSYAEALRLVDLVGIRNVYAAYFLGLVDRIGGA